LKKKPEGDFIVIKDTLEGFNKKIFGYDVSLGKKK